MARSEKVMPEALLAASRRMTISFLNSGMAGLANATGESTTAEMHKRVGVGSITGVHIEEWQPYRSLAPCQGTAMSPYNDTQLRQPSCKGMQ